MSLFQLFLISVLMPKISTVSQKESPLIGKTLRIYVSELPPYMTIKRNSTGHITEIDGTCVETLNWLAQYLGFTREIWDLPVMKSFDHIGDKNGTIDYLLSGAVDWIVGAIIMTESRNQITRLPFPWAIHFANALVPYPETKANISAPLEPFDYKVWILVLLTAILTPVTMQLLSCLYDRTFTRSMDPFERMNRTTEYVISVLLSQGATLYSKRAITRLTAGCLCLSALVLVSAYSCTLISFVNAPNRQILVNSIYDVPDKPHVKLVVTKGKAADITLSSTEKNIYKFFEDMLDRDPNLRCSSINSCLKLVRSGGHVYVDVYAVLMAVISQDLKRTGICHYTTTKERFTFTPATFVIPKNNDYIEFINKGIITMWDTGLIEAWEKRIIPKPVSCLNIKIRPISNPKLSLKHLSGPFVILLFGYGCSLFAFVAEFLWKLRQLLRQ